MVGATGDRQQVINVKGRESRFAKVDRCQFALNNGETPVAKPIRKGKKTMAESMAAEKAPAD